MRFRQRGAPEPEAGPVTGAPHQSSSELDELREGYRRDAYVYRGGLSDDACQALDAIMEVAGFAGASDPPALGLLAFLVRTMKPIRVLQLGTLLGYSAVLIADILRTNGRGHLITVDPDAAAHESARGSVSRAGLDEWITFVDDFSTGETMAETAAVSAPFELVYLDASHSYSVTLQELDLLLGPGGWLDDNGLLVAHDAAEGAAAYDPSGDGGVRRALDEWTTSHPGVADRIILEPPFWPGLPGLALLKRRHTLPA